MHLITIALAALQIQAAQIDTTLRVPAGTRLDVYLRGGGTITVTGWNRPDVQITAQSTPKTRVETTLDGAVLRVLGFARTGVAVSDIKINVPRAMSLKLGGADVDITVKDSEGEINVTNYRGVIDVTGGRKTVWLKSTLGEIKLVGARGDVEAATTDESVTITDVVGDVKASSSSKHVTLVRVDSKRLQAESVGGVIKFSGPFHGDGQYSFSTHNGSVFATVIGAVDATIAVATVQGNFHSPLQYRITDRRREGIFTAIFGSGRAQVQLESFGGGIVVNKE